MSMTPSTSVKTWNGNPVNLTCIAEAIPNATIKWSFNGRNIQDDDLYTIHGRSAHSNLLVGLINNKLLLLFVISHSVLNVTLILFYALKRSDHLVI